MLLAVVAVAVLTALAMDLAYDTQVRLRIAGNARDQLRAEALAQSAVNLSRLVLAFQAQLDQATSLPAMVQAATAATGQVVPQVQLPHLQLYNLVPVSSALAQTLFSDEGASAPKKSETSVPTGSLGDFEGGFLATIEDEGQKINAQLDARFTSGVLSAQVEALLRLTCDNKWDPLFDRTDADGQRYSRSDLLVHLRDWVLSDPGGSVLTVTFPAGNCSFIVPSKPFDTGFSDKNFPYQRGSDRYFAKGARLDSVRELSLVAGVTDPFLAAFGPELTVYLPIEAAMNVNTDDLTQQLRLAQAMADPAALAEFSDPHFQEAFHKALSQIRMGGFLTITPSQFAGVLQELKVPLRSDLSSTLAKAYTDRSVVFRIRALGKAGDVTAEVEAVVSYDPRLSSQGTALSSATSRTATQAAPTASGTTAIAAAAAQNRIDLGRLIHFREE
ncbi:MAG TPA: hypothetical protein VFG53_08940 [Anaeromyxobacter sp.]|nr:hypothetical protein [Anaeromyxobacter sp.]